MGSGKGQAWERACCKRLSLWLTEGKRDDLFWRSAMSGGRATIQHRRGIANKSQLGDISAIDEMGERLLLRYVIVECKHRANIGLISGFLEGRGKLAEWWKKEVSKAEGTSRWPFMIVMQNRVPALLITPWPACEHIKRIPASRALFSLGRWPLSPFVFIFDDVVPRIDHWAPSGRIKKRSSA